MKIMNIDEIIESFELFDDWEDKYRYLIDLGEALPELEEKYKSDNWKIKGCQSQVWLVPEFVEVDGKKYISFRGDSDAALVRGLIAIVLAIFEKCQLEEIVAKDVGSIFAQIGLEEHLSPSRRNGLLSMVDKIKYYAKIG